MRSLALVFALLPLAACDFPVVPTGASTTTTVAPDLSDGTVARGTLADGDAARPGGQLRDDVATVTVPPGGTLEVMMESTEFDTYLLVEVVGTGQSVTNDDFNGSRARSVIVQPNPSDQPVQARIVATAFGSGHRGAYEVRYAVREPAPAPVAREFAPGSTGGHLSGSSAVVPLTSTDDERRADAYAVQLAAGTPVTFRMESGVENDGFDPYLRLHNVAGRVAYNDDFQGSRSVSQITFTPTVSGAHILYAGAFSATGAGEYTLRYTVGSDTEATTTDLGGQPTTIEGTISDGDDSLPLIANGEARPVDVYTVHLQAGQTVEVVLESADFDTYLKLNRGDSFLARNDDDGSIRRSTIRYTAAESGTHQIYAGTFHDHGRGAYTLSYRVE